MFVLFQVPEIRHNLEKNCGGDWKQIAEFQMKEYFNPSTEQIQEQAKRYRKP